MDYVQHYRSPLPLLLIFINLIFNFHQCLSLDIHIGGIFKVDSISEKALSLAVVQHNNDSNRRYRLVTNFAMLQQFESNVVMNKICQQASQKGVVAIFGGNFTFVIQEVNDISQILQMPIFTTDLDVTDISITRAKATKSTPNNYLLYMHPPVINTLIDYLIDFKWISFSYICNTGQGLYHLQHIIQTIHSRKDYVELNVDVRFISDPRLATKDLRNLDSYLKSLSPRRIVINIDTRQNLEIILHRIVLMGMNRPEYSYIILNANLEEIDLHEFRYSGVEIIGFSIVSNNSSLFQQFHNDWINWVMKSRNKDGLNNTLEAALMRDAVNVFTEAMNKIVDNKESFKSLMRYLEKKGNPNCYTMHSPNRRRLLGYRNRKYEVTNSTLGQIIMNNIISSTHISGLTGALQFRSNGVRSNFSVDILQMKINQGPEKIGNWYLPNGIKISDKFRQYLKKSLIKNQTVRVVTIESKPFMQRKRQKQNEKLEGNSRFEGFCVDLLNQTAKMLGFKYEIHLVRDNNYGAKIGEYPNGTEIWNGMIGELINGTADMAVAPLTISLARAKVVHFSEPFLMFGLSVMIKKPGPKKAGIFSFLRPLSYPVWGCYIAACLVVSCGLYVIARLSPYEWSSSESYELNQKVTRDFTFFNCLWFSIAAFVQQGVDVAPKSPGARILSSVWWFFTLIMIAYYTANLAAFLTISLIITPINDWNDLVKPGVGIDYGSTNSGSTTDFFLKTKLEPFRQMGEFMKRNSHVFASTVDDGVARVRKSKGNYAFLLESRMNEYFNNRQPCDTMMVGTPFGDKGYGIATPLDYALKEDITDAILKLREKQILTKLYKDWWIKKGECNQDNSNSNSGALLLINVAGVFYILAGGLTFAMFISMLEFYYESRRRASKVVIGRLQCREQWRHQLYYPPPAMVGSGVAGNNGNAGGGGNATSVGNQQRLNLCDAS